jgi:peptide/nickel transport system substrate-binding protein
MRCTPWLLLMFSAVLACGRAAVEPERQWSIAVSALPGALTGGFAASSDDVNLAALLSAPLTEVRVRESGVTHDGGLLARWAWSEDSRVLTATLRSDASWSDGMPMTAYDVAYAFRVVLDEQARSPRRALFVDLQGPPSTPDETTVVWTYRTPGDPDARLAALSAVPPMPSHRLQGVAFHDLASHADVMRPVASGAFVIARDTAEGLLLRARRPTPQGVESLVVRVVPDAMARREAFLAGELDVLAGLSRDDLQALAGVSGVRRIDRGPRTLEAIVVNARDPLLADANVRAALRQSADVAGWAAHLVAPVDGAPIALPAKAPFPPWQLRTPAAFPSAAPACGDAFDAVGWTRSETAATRHVDGAPVRLSLLVNAENPRRVQVATAWQADLAKLGVALQIESLPLAAFKERIAASQFQLAFHGFGAPIVANPGPAWASPEDPAHRGANVTGLHDPAVDAAIRVFEAARPEARAQALADVAEAIDAAAVVLPLWWLHEWVAIGPRVAEAHPDLVSPWRDLEAWTYGGSP